jgi:hypothetical protein
MGFQWCKRCVQILQFEYENTLQILKFEQDIWGILGGKKLPVIFYFVSTYVYCQKTWWHKWNLWKLIGVYRGEWNQIENSILSR